MIDIAVPAGSGRLFTWCNRAGSQCLQYDLLELWLPADELSGFASQAYGARDLAEVMHVLIRTLLIGLGIGA